MTTQRQRFARRLSTAVTTRPMLLALLRIKQQRIIQPSTRRTAPVQTPLQAA